MPYGFYTLLRLVATGVFVWASIVSYQRGLPLLPWLFALLAVLFNPLIKVHLPKELWIVIDLGAGVLLLATRPKIEQCSRPAE